MPWPQRCICGTCAGPPSQPEDTTHVPPMFFSLPPTLISLLLAFAISTLDKCFHSNSLWCVVVYICSPMPWWWSHLSSQLCMRCARVASPHPISHLSLLGNLSISFCSAFMFPVATLLKPSKQPPSVDPLTPSMAIPEPEPAAVKQLHG